jgi:septum formation protein
VNWQQPIILASGSTRRAALLSQSGIVAKLSPPTFDDGVFACGTMKVERWVQSLAMLKAKNVLSDCKERAGTILAADTVCVVDGQILGQPKSKEHAGNMLRAMLDQSHQVYTGWCLCSVESNCVISEFEQSEIQIGFVDDEEIEKYLVTDNWKGKAGGYNLSERVDAGWPIVCIGDPTNVMGLPMNRLNQELAGDMS